MKNAGSRHGMRVHMRPVMCGGRPKYIMILVGKCTWCGRTNTQCAAFVCETGNAVSFNGCRSPTFRMVATLCSKCFLEYWQAGGSDREAA